MKWIGERRSLALIVAGLLLLPHALFAQAARSLSFQEQEHFLATAKLMEIHTLAQGVTGSQRATLSDGTLTHDAHIQTIDEFQAAPPTASGYEANFRDSFKFNVAAYRLNRMLGLDMIPATVERRIDGRLGSVTWWLDDILMAEKDRYLNKIEPPGSEAWNKQIFIVRVFDQLIHNSDRNLGNLMITKGWKLWMIDHTRSFRISIKLENPKQLSICERGLLAAMRKLERTALNREMAGVLSEGEIGALLARRDVIVRFFDEAITEKGDASVLYDLAADSQD